MILLPTHSFNWFIDHLAGMWPTLFSLATFFLIESIKMFCRKTSNQEQRCSSFMSTTEASNIGVVRKSLWGLVLILKILLHFYSIFLIFYYTSKYTLVMNMSLHSYIYTYAKLYISCQGKHCQCLKILLAEQLDLWK